MPISLSCNDSVSVERIPREIDGPYGSSFSSFLWNLRTVLPSWCTALKAVFENSPFCTSLPASAAVFFLTTALLTGMRGYLNVVLTCISLKTSCIEHLGLLYFIFKNVYFYICSFRKWIVFFFCCC